MFPAFPVVILMITDDDDREFMQTLWSDYYRIMRTEAYLILGRSEPIDDLIQDAIVLLIGKISTLRALDCCKLHTYVVNTIKGVTKNFIKHSDVQRKHTYLGKKDDARDIISESVVETYLDVYKVQLKEHRQSAQKIKDAKQALFERYTSGIMDTTEYKAENAELTRQLNYSTQMINDLETALEQTKRKPEKQSQLSTATEFNVEMMTCVRSIKVYSANHAIVDIDVPVLRDHR